MFVNSSKGEEAGRRGVWTKFRLLKIRYFWGGQNWSMRRRLDEISLKEGFLILLGAGEEELINFAYGKAVRFSERGGREEDLDSSGREREREIVEGRRACVIWVASSPDGRK
jgi:hypothetical protein